MQRAMMLGFLGVVVAITGCSGGVETMEVSGLVLVDGRPLENIEVKFHSTSPTAVVSATTNSNGRYHLNLVTGENGDDAKHRVVLTDLNIYEFRDAENEEPDSPVSRIHQKYAHLLTSNLAVNHSELGADVDFDIEGSY